MKFYLFFLIGFLFSFVTFAKTKNSSTNNRSFSENNGGDWVINGDVTLSNNYTVVVGSKLVINPGAILTISNGSVLTNDDHTGNGIFNDGTIIISNGGTLTNHGDFHTGSNNFRASISVNGTLYNGGIIYYDGGDITIAGILNNNSVIIGGIVPITVNNGGTFNNLTNGYFLADDKFIVNTGGTFTNTGKLSGNVTFGGNANLFNSGILAPGNSPGVYNVTGNYTAASSAIHNFEVAGTSSTQYDRLLVTGNLNLNGTLNVSLISGFIPTTSNDLTIMTGTVNGTFSTVNMPPSYSLIYNSNSVILRHLQALPVNFVSFDAKKEIAGVELTWKVGTEDNLAKYEIEKSKDGKQFMKIGFQNASGQSIYVFVDQQYSNTSFYRIKSIDLDGKYRYSSIIKINNGKSSILFAAYPSPAKDQIILQHSTANASSQISIFSIDGKFVMSVIPALSAQQTIINISNLRAGAYIISYQNENILEKVKIIIE